MGPFTAIAGGLSPELREQPRPGRRRFFGCAFALVSPTRRKSRLALMARALRHDVSHGRLRTHFPSGPSSRPVPGVQVDARRRRRKSNLNSGLRTGVVFCRARDRTAPFCRGRRNQRVIPNTWRAGLFSSDVQREPQLRPTVLGARRKEASLETGAAASAHLAGTRVLGSGLLPGLLASLPGAALLCRPPPRVSDVHRQPTRPVLKHGPRSPGRSRVVGAHYEPRRRSESERACWRAPDLDLGLRASVLPARRVTPVTSRCPPRVRCHRRSRRIFPSGGDDVCGCGGRACGL